MSDIPRYNWHEIIEDSAQLDSVKDFERYLLDSNVKIPEPPAKDDTREFLNINYKDAPPDIQAQIEEKYGLQPSALHDTNLAHQAIKTGAEQAQIEQGAAQNDPTVIGGVAQPTGQPTPAGAGATA
jgi:hypothetical protein